MQSLHCFAHCLHVIVLFCKYTLHSCDWARSVQKADKTGSLVVSWFPPFFCWQRKTLNSFLSDKAIPLVDVTQSMWTWNLIETNNSVMSPPLWNPLARCRLRAQFLLQQLEQFNQLRQSNQLKHLTKSRRFNSSCAQLIVTPKSGLVDEQVNEPYEEVLLDVTSILGELFWKRLSLRGSCWAQSWPDKKGGQDSLQLNKQVFLSKISTKAIDFVTKIFQILDQPWWNNWH